MSTLSELMAVSGLPGLYRIINNRPNGLVAENLDTGKRKFLPMRKHQFSPLETIAVFTLTDSIPLLEVFDKIRAKLSEVPLPAPKSTDDELRAYFRSVLPEHDEYRVFPRDIKKIVKWFVFLEERNLLAVTGDEEE